MKKSRWGEKKNFIEVMSKQSYFGKGLITILILLFILVQNWYIVLSFDDFAYATLSYFPIQGIPDGYYVGREYNIVDIIKFIVWSYFNWGGRIVCYFVEILLLRSPLIITKILQAILVILWGIYISSFGKIKKSWWLWILSIGIFYMMDLSIFRDGVMWLSASFGYLWPSVLVVIMLNWFCLESWNCKHKMWYVVGMFLAGCSSEYVGLFLCAVSFLYTCISFLFNHKIDRTRLLGMIFAIIGYAIVFFAPGNQVRMESNSEFYSLSLVDRMITRAGDQFWIIFHEQLFPLVIVLHISFLILTSRIRKKKLYSFLTGIQCILLVDYIYIYCNPQYYTLLGAIVRVIIWLAIVIFVLLIYTYYCRNAMIISAFGGVLAIWLAGFMAPNGGARSFLPFYMFTPLVLFGIINQMNIKVNRYCIISITIFALMHVSSYIYGYSLNYTIRTENAEELTCSAEEIRKGAEISKIILTKYDLNFAESNPWGEQPSDVAIKLYYGIPQEVEIMYE